MGTERLTATVVGGGIAGLASAVSLAQAGWHVTVLERAPLFGEVGAGLAVTGNGMTALAALGLDGLVRAVGYQTTTGGYQDSGGRWLMRIPGTRSDVTTIWGLNRQRLHAVLLQAAEAADGVELVTGAEVIAVQPGTPGGEQAAVTWRTSSGTSTAGRRPASGCRRRAQHRAGSVVPGCPAALQREHELAGGDSGYCHRRPAGRGTGTRYRVRSSASNGGRDLLVRTLPAP